MAEQTKKKLVAFSTEQKHMGTLMGFNDAQMNEVYGGGDMTSIETPAATDTTSMETPTAEVPSPCKDKIDRIKTITAGAEVDKTVKSDGEKLIARLEEAEKIFTDADKYLTDNEKAAAVAPTETASTETPAPAATA